MVAQVLWAAARVAVHLKEVMVTLVTEVQVMAAQVTVALAARVAMVHQAMAHHQVVMVL